MAGGKCPETNQHMRGVDITVQKKVTCQLDHHSRIKYCFNVVFDLLDIAVNNSLLFSRNCDLPTMKTLIRRHSVELLLRV